MAVYIVITPFGVLLLVYKANAPRVRPCKLQQQTKGVIISLLIVARWYDITTLDNVFADMQ